MTNLDYLYNPDAAQKFFAKNYFVDKKLSFRIVEHGTVVPYVLEVKNGQRVFEAGGVVDGNGRFIGSSVGKFGEDDTYSSNDKIPYVPATVIYLGLFYLIWGHCLTENLRYIWFLRDEICKNLFKDCPLVYIPWKAAVTFDCRRNFARLLEILEVKVDNLYPIDGPTQFERIILPDESFFLDNGDRKFTSDYREIIDHVRNFALKNRTPTSSSKVYYLHGQCQVGEERLAEYFKSKGYVIVRPESLTLDEQLNLLINCKSFASTVGSSAHNSIFLRDGTEVILIPRAAERFTGYQQTLEQVHNLRLTYVDSSLSLFVNGNGGYCYIISKHLKEFFGDKWDGYAEEDFKIFLSYVRVCMTGGLEIDSNTERYYGETLKDFLIQLKQREDLLTAYGVALD